MIPARSSTVILLLMIFIISMTACSKNGSTPIEPDTDMQFDTPAGSRNLIAVYDAVIDPDAGTFEITPVERKGAYHLPLTQYYPNALKIKNYGFVPAFWADIELAHPFPGSGIAAFDPRVIAIVPANPGNQIYFPAFNVLANNSIVYQPDGYTKMYDDLGGAIAGNTNPFKFYFTDRPYHVWPSNGETDDTLRWYINTDGFGGPMTFKLVVDVSTNYPDPPLPVTDNSSAPVKFDLQIGDGLTPDGGSAIVTAELLDWQGETGIKCKVEAPALFTGGTELFYSGPGPGPNEYVFEGSISNDLLAPPGDYGILLVAWDTVEGNHQFYMTSATVHSLINPIEVTPPELLMNPWESYVVGDLLYVASGMGGLQIYNCSNPADITLAGNIMIPGESIAVQVIGDYAYLGTRGWQGETYGFVIVDISTPASPSIVGSVDLDSVNEITLNGNYAYVSRSNDGISIVDFSDPANPVVVKTLDGGGQCRNITYSNGYAFVGVSQELKVVDVDPPETASIVHTLPPSQTSYMYDIYAAGDFLYGALSMGLWVVDISSPESANELQILEIGWRVGVMALGDYAYVVGDDTYGNEEITIVNISTPGSAFVEEDMNLNYYGEVFTADGQTAYVSSGAHGLNIVDVDLSGGMNLIDQKISASYCMGAALEGDYAYLNIDDDDSFSRVAVLDVSTPELTSILGYVDISDYGLTDIDYSANYVYMTHDYDDYIYVVDVSDPWSPYIETDISQYNPWRLEISGSTLFGLGWGEFFSVDISDPTSPSIDDYYDALTRLEDLIIVGDYAYIVTNSGDMHVFDVSDTTSLSLLHTTPLTEWGEEITSYNGYAYVGLRNGGVDIVDIDPPGSASMVSSLTTPDDVRALQTWNGFLFIGYDDEVEYYDLTDPIEPLYDNSITILGGVSDIDFNAGYGYISTEAGLQIFDM